MSKPAGPSLIPAQASPDHLSPNVTLQIAKAWLRARVEDGANCPCCHQMAKIYKRKIHYTIAAALIRLHRLAVPENDYYVHVPTAISPACEIGKARYWGLIEEAGSKRPDGGRAGWWRLTEDGYAFVEGRIRIKEYARIYNGRCLGLDGNLMNIQDALGEKFNYNELMGRE